MANRTVTITITAEFDNDSDSLDAKVTTQIKRYNVSTAEVLGIFNIAASDVLSNLKKVKS